MHKHLSSQFPPMPPGSLQGHAHLTLVGDLVLVALVGILIASVFITIQTLWEMGSAITVWVRRVWRRHQASGQEDKETDHE